MRISALSASLTACLLLSGAFAQSVTADLGMKTARLRLNGGSVVSRDVIGFADTTASLDNGLFAGGTLFLAPRRTSDEFDVGGGLKHACLGSYVCNVNAYAWLLPPFKNLKGDAVDTTVEFSRSYDLGGCNAIGWLAHYDYLTFFGAGTARNAQVFRGMGNGTLCIFGQPVNLSAGMGYRTDKDRVHFPFLGSTTWALTNDLGVTLGGDGFYIPVLHQLESEAVLTLTWKL